MDEDEGDWVDLTEVGSPWQVQLDPATDRWRHRRAYPPAAAGACSGHAYVVEGPWRRGRPPGDGEPGA